MIRREYYEQLFELVNFLEKHKLPKFTPEEKEYQYTKINCILYTSNVQSENEIKGLPWWASG